MCMGKVVRMGLGGMYAIAVMGKTRVVARILAPSGSGNV